MAKASSPVIAQALAELRSSVAALGLIGDGSLSDETTPSKPADYIGVYKRSKYQAEQAVLGMT